MKVEHLLGGLEGDFVRVSSAIISNPRAKLAEEDVEHLRLFLVIQMFRTEQAINKTRDMITNMHDLMFRGDVSNVPDIGDLSDENLVLRNIKLSLAFYRGLTDLAFIVVQNESSVPLYTSDSPALATNRLFLQRFKMDNFGLGQSGVILYMPVSPDVGIIFYDRDVYVSRDPIGHPIVLRSERDAWALNRLIVLEARQNIYFRGEARAAVSFTVATRADFTPRWNSGAVFAPDPLEDSGVYERVADDHRQEGSMFYVTSVHYPNPESWISKLQFRRRMIGYTNGSAVGYVRRHTAGMDRAAVWKVDLNTAPPPPTPSGDPKGRFYERSR